MTLSWPSFLAAATSASIPPRSVALGAVAALPPAAAAFFSGGEQAAVAAIVAAARMTTAVRARMRTYFLLLRTPGPGAQVDHEEAEWTRAVRQTDC